MAVPSLSIELEALFAGGRGGTLSDGTATGMLKAPVIAPVALAEHGLAGDYHADPRVHGGPDKALHHFPAEHYAALAARFPAATGLLVPGSIGENLSASGLTEADIHLGDVFALGSARIRVTQPRRPCWKIDRRYDAHGMAAWIVEQGLTGWYYAVVSPGTIAPGDSLTLLEREARAPSVAEFHAATRSARPPTDALTRWSTLDALPAAWRTRLRQRLAWLARHR